MKAYANRLCKIYILIACILGVFLFLFWEIKREKACFLGLEEITIKERDSITATRREEKETNLLKTLYFNHDKIASDNENIYYLPLSWEEEWEKGKITGDGEGCRICVVRDSDRKAKNEYQADGDKLLLLIFNDESYQEVFLIITALPVMSIRFSECPKEVTLEEEEVFCEFDFYAPKQEGERKVQSISTYCRIHKRGGSTKEFEKCGLKVELVDEKGKKENRNLCNLRDDDDWILIPMYAEESKIRDKFSIDLWRDISSGESENNTGTQMEYVELILNGAYYGLFGLAVPIDEKLLDLQQEGEESDLLFKIDGPSGVDLEALNQAGEKMEAGNVSVKYPKEMSQEKWDTIREFFYLVYYEDDKLFTQKIQSQIEMDNMADCYLFLNLIYGKDNTLKNMYYCMRLQENGTYKVSLIPWDMDLSLGTLYDPENTNGLYWTYDTEQRLEENECACYLTKRLRDLNVGNFEKILRERYQIYRQSIFTEEELFGRIENLADTIIKSGAYERDAKRWQNGGYSTDYSKMQGALRSRLKYLRDLEGEK